MRALVAIVIVASVLVGTALGAPPKARVTGIVTRGPITPVCVAESPCDAPAQGVTLVFSRKGAPAGRAVTRADGRYSLRLAAGLYSVARAGVGRVDRKLEPIHVRVYGGRLNRVNFAIDTGIR